MDIPNKIQLLGEVYKIKVLSQKDVACSVCGDNAVGKLDFDNKTIYVAADSKYEVDEILLHELGHYFGFYYGLSESECFAESFAKFFKLVYDQIFKEK